MNEKISDFLPSELGSQLSCLFIPPNLRIDQMSTPFLRLSPNSASGPPSLPTNSGLPPDGPDENDLRRCPSHPVRLPRHATPTQHSPELSTSSSPQCVLATSPVETERSQLIRGGPSLCPSFRSSFPRLAQNRDLPAQVLLLLHLRSPSDQAGCRLARSPLPPLPTKPQRPFPAEELEEKGEGERRAEGEGGEG
jgi:hypothetical protein